MYRERPEAPRTGRYGSVRSRLILVTVIVASLLAGAGSASPSVAATEPLYYLPVAAGTSLTVAQGNDEPDFRSRDERNAFDFTAVEGERSRFEVAAARGGTVMSIRDSVPGGRCQA